jgi:hypothetical protein
MGRVEPRTARGTSRRRLMPREQEGREAAWASETDPQTRQIASARPNGAKDKFLLGMSCYCGGGNHVDLRGLRGGAEAIRTDGHRGREISSWIAAWGIRSPTQGRLVGGPAFAGRLSISGKRNGPSSYHLSLRSHRKKEAKANAENTSIARRRHPEEPPLTH